MNYILWFFVYSFNEQRARKVLLLGWYLEIFQMLSRKIFTLASHPHHILHVVVAKPVIFCRDIKPYRKDIYFHIHEFLPKYKKNKNCVSNASLPRAYTECHVTLNNILNAWWYMVVKTCLQQNRGYHNAVSRVFSSDGIYQEKNTVFENTSWIEE